MRIILPKHLYLLVTLLLLFLNKELLAQTCTVSISAPNGVSVCEGTTTTLQAAPAFTATSYQWYRDDVAIPTATAASYPASESGRYYVIASGTGCSDITSNALTVTVRPTPTQPSVNVNPSGAICSGTPVTFTVINAEDVFYTWNFGDGSTVTGRDATVTHTYNATGVGSQDFTVSVFATSANGCPSVTRTTTVTVNKIPEISFTETENDFATCLPDSVEDDEISVVAKIANTTAPEFQPSIRTYFVDFSDGRGELPYQPGQFPISNDAAPYDTVGSYPIRIRAVTNDGCEITQEYTYAVSKKPIANFSANDKKRENESQQPPCVPVIVTPSDSSSGGGLTYKWSVEPEQGWELQSGSLDADDPVFLFTVSGVYNIKLIVENTCGSDTTEQSVVVGWPQLQLPQGGVFCGPTTIDYSSSGPTGGGGPNAMFVDKNLGENLTGSITITGPKGTTFQFNSDVFQFSFNFDTPGRYLVTAVARNECGSSNDIYMGQPPPPVEVIILQQPNAPTIQQPGVICAGETATLTPTGPGPVYAWFENNDPAAVPIFVGPSFTTPPLPGGNKSYFVAAVDTAQGVVCVGPATEVVVRVNPRVENNTIEGDATRNVCKGGTVAELTGSAPTGGDTSTPYIFTWIQSTTGPGSGFTAAQGVNNNQNYTPPAQINVTTWFRRIVRSGNCLPDTSAAVQIIAVDPVPLSANTVTPTLQEICAGDTPAQLIGSSPTGGAGAPYTYLWEISTVGPNSGFVPAPTPNTGENYTVPGSLAGENWFRRVVSSGGCSTPSAPVKISVFPALANNTITPAQQDICTGTAPPVPLAGSAPTGGNGTYKYQWLSSSTGNPGSFTPAQGTNNEQSYTPGNITQTTYFQRVVTSGDCTPSTSETAVINIRPGITNNSISASQTICAGEVPTELTGPTPSGGSGSFTYRWESSISGPTAGFSPAAGTNSGQDYTPPALTRETWFRRVALSQGCENASVAVRIGINPVPAAPTLTVRDARACTGGSATLTVANPNGGNTYEWFDVATGGAPIFVGPSFTTPPLTQNTTFYVQAVNASNCPSTTRTSASVTVVTPVADAGNDVTIIQGRTTELRATGGVTYQWAPATGLSNPNVANPVASPDVTTTYTVTVTTAEGCEATDEVTVTVIPAIIVPNAFSPNGDGVNEVWEIDNIQNYPDAQVEVFNRWGNKIFISSTGYTTPWDGRHNGKELPVATYYYIIYLNSSERPISGHVTIIR
ncbi:Ig-like domain-containing protein [Botryobacter ruber]|uniref:Ig-like domain-containing protein n=1 Tax=Botryobacter ruber TaxID=2171629 RepID=UPI000E0CB045|nr:gliding motility-associated C-terminal domain-containing protein [Botryobacter ruber]